MEDIRKKAKRKYKEKKFTNLSDFASRSLLILGESVSLRKMLDWANEDGWEISDAERILYNLLKGIDVDSVNDLYNIVSALLNFSPTVGHDYCRCIFSDLEKAQQKISGVILSGGLTPFWISKMTGLLTRIKNFTDTYERKLDGGVTISDLIFEDDTLSQF